MFETTTTSRPALIVPALVDPPYAIEIAVGCDDVYARHLTIMLMSLFAHSWSRPVHVRVFVPADFKSEPGMRASLGEHHCKLQYVTMDDRFAGRIRTRHGFSPAVFYRLMLGDLMPSERGRVLYLDCDMIVRRDLGALWTLDIGDTPVAAVPDPGFVDHATLGMEPGTPYFNSGVMLIDLALWRSERVGERALQFAADHPERLTFNDQCALNWVLRDRWHALDPTWNLQHQHIARRRGREFRYVRPVPAAAKQAAIVHFNAPGRPWLYMDDHPMKREYRSYLARTPWRGVPEPDRYPHNIIRKTLGKRAPFLLPAYLGLRRFV